MTHINNINRLKELQYLQLISLKQRTSSFSLIKSVDPEILFKVIKENLRTYRRSKRKFEGNYKIKFQDCYKKYNKTFKLLYKESKT